MTSLELKIPPLVLVIAIGILMVVASGYLPRVDINLGLRVTMAVVVFGLGAYCCIAGVLAFRKNQTTVDPRYPDKTSQLVDNGIYKVSRNPMYVGFALFLMSVVLSLGSPVLLLGVIVFIMYMNRFQIKPEEASLSKTFGAQYEEYKRKVRRWL